MLTLYRLAQSALNRLLGRRLGLVTVALDRVAAWRLKELLDRVADGFHDEYPLRGLRARQLSRTLAKALQDSQSKHPTQWELRRFDRG